MTTLSIPAIKAATVSRCRCGNPPPLLLGLVSACFPIAFIDAGPLRGQDKIRPLIYDLFTIFYAMKSAPGFIQLATLLQGVSMDREIAQRPHRVTAMFQNTRLSFDIERKTTLAQLVEQLSVLGEAHGGLPLSVDVRIAVESTR